MGTTPLIALAKQYVSESDCELVLLKIRWPFGVLCGRCRSKEIQSMYARGTARYLFACRKCRYQFTVTTGTIFHRSHLSLLELMLLLYLTSVNPQIPSHKLALMLGVTYKTAWRLRKAILEVMTRQRDYTRNHGGNIPVSGEETSELYLDALAERFRTRLPIFMQKLLLRGAVLKPAAF